MPQTHDISDQIMDTIVRNKVQQGHYVMFSFAQGDIPEILFRGVDDKHWNIIESEIRDIRGQSKFQ